MHEILRKYVGQQIGINLQKPFHIDTANVIAVYENYFTLTLEKHDDQYHLPILNIVRVIENPNGVTVGGLFRQKKTYPLIVKIGHIVEYVSG